MFSMSLNGPHPEALFSLVPENDKSQAVLDHPMNRKRISVVEAVMKGGEIKTLYGLDVGPHIASKSNPRYTLATIGRFGDIVVDEQDIEVSRTHCSFEIHEETAEVMLRDRSANRTTQLYGSTCAPFEPWRPHRQVVLDDNVNSHFGFGGPSCNRYQFRMVWHRRLKAVADLNIKRWEEDPQQTRTVLLAPPPIDVQAQYRTLVHTPVGAISLTLIHTPVGAIALRYSERGSLGSGGFSEVVRAANIDSGEHVAVKKVKTARDVMHMVRKEAAILSSISHVSESPACERPMMSFS